MKASAAKPVPFACSNTAIYERVQASQAYAARMLHVHASPKTVLKQTHGQTYNQIVFGALMFVNRVATIAGDERLPLVLRHP